ncbi:hypothetical protein D0O09_19810 [Pseudomonas putida]|nr:hypothetical protein D0O09_19810 [Pseudomonas putida]
MSFKPARKLQRWPKYLYLISYILDKPNPETCEITQRPGRPQPQSARDYLQGLHRNEASSFTDVQVHAWNMIMKPGTSPGHYQQP